MPATLSTRTALVGLRGVRLLAGLDTPSLEDLAKHLDLRRYRSGQQVITRNAADRSVYLVVAGTVRVAAFSSGGRQVTYREIGAGGHFGELAAIDGGSRSADVIALEDSLLAAMSPAMFRRLLLEHETARERVLQSLASLVREMTDRVFELSTLGVRNRVHAELLRLAREGKVSGSVARIDPAPTHGDIANRISTYREQVTRELSRLTAQGVIAREGRCLIVRDLARLEVIVADVSWSP